MIPTIIVPVLKFYDSLQNMLDTVDYPINHIIIIDNGGELKNLKCSFANKISIINMPYNLGVPTSWNLGIKLSPFSKYWLFSQDDIKWIPGGLEKISHTASENSVCLDMDGPRPFSSFTVGENVIRRVGIFDESYFPLLGDDFNFHKRCHFYHIEEKNISNTFIAEKSKTIREMVATGKVSKETLDDNMLRSLYGPPDITGWNLKKRRLQGDSSSKMISDKNYDSTYPPLDFEYRIHSKEELFAFSVNCENYSSDSNESRSNDSKSATSTDAV